MRNLTHGSRMHYPRSILLQPFPFASRAPLTCPRPLPSSSPLHPSLTNASIRLCTGGNVSTAFLSAYFDFWFEETINRMIHIDLKFFEIFSPSIERNNVHFWELVGRIVYHGSVTKMRKSFFTLLLRTSYPTTNTIIFTAIKTIVLYLKIKNRNISITISHFEYY